MSLPLSIVCAGQPAPDLLAAVERVEIFECVGEPTTYRLRQTLVDKDGDFPALNDARLGPSSELTLAGWIANRPEILVHGPVHAQEVHFEHGVAGSWIEIIGADETMRMEKDVQSKVWGDGKVTAAVATILQSYSFAPDIDEVDAQFTEPTHSLVQRDTDLHFVRRLAQRYGRWFWVERTPANTTIAHFKTPTTSGQVSAHLSINTATHTTSELELAWDIERPTAAVAKQTNVRDKKPIDGSLARASLPPLAARSLADIAGARSLHITAPADSAGDLRGRANAALQEAAFFVRMRGKTSVRAQGAILHAHRLVEVSGLGKRHSGNYLVASVRHQLDAAGHSMEFELIRNAWEAA